MFLLRIMNNKHDQTRTRTSHIFIIIMINQLLSMRIRLKKVNRVIYKILYLLVLKVNYDQLILKYILLKVAFHFYIKYALYKMVLNYMMNNYEILL